MCIRDRQYLRQSYNIKIGNIPTVTGEDVQTKTATNPVTLDVVKQVAQQTDMLLPLTAIDVCHRLGSEPSSPIIIRFRSKSDRWNFAAQKEKLKNVTAADIDLSGIQVPKHIQTALEKRKTDGRGPRPARGGYKNATQRKPVVRDGSESIFLQDHLTQRNKDLLKEAKAAFKQTFQYPGYVMNGEIRVKRHEDEKFHVIKSSADIKALNALKPRPPPKPK